MSTATAETKADDVLDPGQVAAMLRVTPATVLQWVKNGSLPKPVRVARTFRWRRSVIEDLLAGRTDAPFDMTQQNNL